MDNTLFASIFQLANQGVCLDTFIILFAGYWEYIVAVGFLGYLLLPKHSIEERKKRARTVGWAILAAVVARLGVVNLIRLFYFRERPFVLEEFTPLLDHAANSAFPSGHAAFFMALAVYFLLAKEKKFGWFLFASALLIGIARVAAGIHWPTDILAGWIIGFLVSIVLWYFMERRKQKEIQ